MFRGKGRGGGGGGGVKESVAYAKIVAFEGGGGGLIELLRYTSQKTISQVQVLRSVQFECK